MNDKSQYCGNGSVDSHRAALDKAAKQIANDTGLNVLCVMVCRMPDTAIPKTAGDFARQYDDFIDCHEFSWVYPD